MSKTPNTSQSPTKTPPTIVVSAAPTAGVLRRLIALVYDAFLLFGLLVTPLLIAIAAMSPPHEAVREGSVTHDLPSIAPKPVILAYMLIVVVSFYCYFWRTTGQTLGMQAWRIRVDAESGGRASWRQCFIRAAVGFFSILCAGLGYWWVWIDKNRVSWHDRASNTRVIVLPKRK
jgi:uncharacterized RDD family membrane protein YckC